MTLSLILPCYNPPKGWAEHIIGELRQFAEQIGNQPELILVIDGLTERIDPVEVQILQQGIPSLLIIQYEENQGKGYAIRQGVMQAAGDLIMYTDVDFPYNTDSLVKIYRALSSGSCDVAIGVKNEAYYSKVPFVRRRISSMLQRLIKVLLPMPVTDTQCGLKGFHSHVRPVFESTTINRYLFDLEFVHKCYREKLRVLPVPIQLRPGVTFRRMPYSVLFTELFNFVRLLVRNK